MNTNEFPFKLLSSLEVKANADTIKFIVEKHKNYMLEYILDGAGFVEHNGKKYYCPKDSVYFLHPGEDYMYYHDPKCPWSKIFAIFSGELAEALIDAYGLNGKVFFPDQSQCLPYFKELIRIRYNANETASVIFHHIFDLLSTRRYFIENIPPKIQTLKTILEASLNKKFILNDFAAEQHVSSAFLIAKFKEHYNCTPYEYLIQCRLDSACNMLKYTHFSIKEISSIINFNDQYYFSNLFKQKYGVSPSVFRKKHN